MNYERKYKAQVSITERQNKKITELEEQLETLRNENTFLKEYNTASGDEAKALIERIFGLEKTFKEGIEQNKKLAEKLRKTENIIIEQFKKTKKDEKVLNKEYKRFSKNK